MLPINMFRNVITDKERVCMGRRLHKSRLGGGLIQCSKAHKKAYSILLLSKGLFIGDLTAASIARTTSLPSSTVHFLGEPRKYTPHPLDLRFLKIESLSASSITGTAISGFNFRSVLTLTRYRNFSSFQIRVLSTKASEMTSLTAINLFSFIM